MQNSSFLSALVGALFGGIVSFIFNAFKTRADLYSSSYDDLCKQIQSIADLSSEYWLTSVPDFESTDEASVNARKGIKLMEVRIRGFQHLILLSDKQLRPELPEASKKQIKLSLPQFVNALTGADFGSRSEEVNEKQAILVQKQAAELISIIRQGVRNRVSISFWLKRAFRVEE